MLKACLFNFLGNFCLCTNVVLERVVLEPFVQVWETLANIEGDTEFVDAQFQPGEEGLPQVNQTNGTCRL